MTRGEIVLVPFPFTDLTAMKQRPAVVVSRSGASGRDVILAFVTSDLRYRRAPAALLIDSSHPEFTRTGLKTPSVVRLDKLVTLEQSLVLGLMGELPGDLVADVDARLRYALDL